MPNNRAFVFGGKGVLKLRGTVPKRQSKSLWCHFRTQKASRWKKWYGDPAATRRAARQILERQRRKLLSETEGLTSVAVPRTMTCDQDDLRSPQSDQLGREDVQQQDLRGTNDDIRLENGSGVGSLGKRKREEEASEQTGLHHTSDEARSKRRKRPMGGYLGLLGHQPTAQHPPKAAKDIKPAKNDKSTSVLVRLYDLPINEDSEFMTQLTDALIADSDAREAERVASTTTIAEKPQTTSNPTTFPNLTQENIRREYQHTVNTQTKPNVENRTVCSSVDGLTKSMAPSTPLKSVAIDAPSLHLTAQNSDQDFKQTAPDADCAAPSHTVGKEERKCGNNQGLNNTCVIEHKRELVNANPILQ